MANHMPFMDQGGRRSAGRECSQAIAKLVQHFLNFSELSSLLYAPELTSCLNSNPRSCSQDLRNARPRVLSSRATSGYLYWQVLTARVHFGSGWSQLGNRLARTERACDWRVGCARYGLQRGKGDELDSVALDIQLALLAILPVNLTMSRHSRVGSGSSQPLEYEPLLASDNAIPKSRVAVDVQAVASTDVDEEENLGERFAAVRAGEG